ncbi:hypothetical protein ABI59_07435 [Acidobacteria bacterium Mor1]|nr:hypothetical protein ABI59_07435 [Acidobacteria bacterium Mor1]
MSELARSLADAGFAGALREECPLAPFTTWKIGGPAELLAEPVSPEDLVVALGWAAGRRIPWRVLGNGSNLLIRDQGVRGLVLRIRKTLDEVTWNGPEVTAGAGALFPALANQAARRGLAGIEFGAGIPGTIGGAVVMNAGWHEFEIGNHITAVDFVGADGTRRRIPHDDCDFAYRDSRFHREKGIVLAARLKLTPGDAGEIQARLDGFASSRKENQPTELPSCGSVFIQPPGDYAGRLIDAAGLKGTREGAIEVSDKHANFFVNTGGGTAAQVLALVERVEREVEERFGVALTREFELW